MPELLTLITSIFATAREKKGEKHTKGTPAPRFFSFNQKLFSFWQNWMQSIPIESTRCAARASSGAVYSTTHFIKAQLIGWKQSKLKGKVLFGFSAGVFGVRVSIQIVWARCGGRGKLKENAPIGKSTASRIRMHANCGVKGLENWPWKTWNNASTFRHMLIVFGIRLPAITVSHLITHIASGSHISAKFHFIFSGVEIRSRMTTEGKVKK